MLIYILTELFVFICLDNYKKYDKQDFSCRKNHIKYFYKYLAIIILTLVFGLRSYSVGTDTKNYLQIFNWLGTNLDWNVMVYEKGFCILSIITNKIFRNFTALLLISGFIIYWNIITAFCELSELPAVSMLCFFGIGSFAQSCNLLRQYLALSFCLIGLYYLIKKNNNFIFIIYIFIAFLFHKSAVVFIIFLPIKYMQFSIKYLILFCSGTILIILFLPYILKLFDLITGSSYYGYINIKSNTFTFYNFSIILFSFLTLMLLLKFKSIVNDKFEKEYVFYIYMFTIFFCLILISIFSVELVDRIAIYFLPSIFFLVPIILESIKSYKSKFLIEMMFIVFFILIFYTLVIRGSYEFLPYKFIQVL